MGQNELIQKLESEAVLKSTKIKEAFMAVDRAEYVPRRLKRFAYDNSPLPIGEGQTISQPATVIFMLELLGVRAGDRVLEIGAGSGWVTALLSKLVGESGFVYSYEINQKLGKFGIANLKRNKVKNYSYSICDAKTHWSENAPYNKIIAGAAFPYIYKDLYGLVNKGGTTVIPIQPYDILKITKSLSIGEIDHETYFGFVFVPLK